MYVPMHSFISTVDGDAIGYGVIATSVILQLHLHSCSLHPCMHCIKCRHLLIMHVT